MSNKPPKKSSVPSIQSPVFSPQSPITGPRSLKLLATHGAPVYALATGDSDEWIFTGGGDKIVALWNVKDGTQHPFTIKTDASIFSLAYHALEKIVFIGCSNGVLHAIDTVSKRERRAWTLDAAGVFDLKWDIVGNRLLVAGGSGILTVIDSQTLEVIRSIPLSDAKLRRVAVRAEDNLLAVADSHGLVHVLEAETLQTIETIRAHEEGCTAVLWHPEKSVLITGGKDAMIRCWNAANQFKQVFHFAAHLSTIYDIIYHKESNSIVTCSRDKTVKWWKPDTFDPIQKIDFSAGGHKHSVNRLLGQGSFVVSASDDRNVILFGV